LAKKKQAFPEFIYIAREEEPDGSHYFLIYEDVEEITEDASVVGIYRLVDEGTVTVRKTIETKSWQEKSR
jgi:hypothetical protein